MDNQPILDLMATLRDQLRNSGRFTPIRPDRYVHNRSGILVETGYMTGEATVRLQDPGLTWKVIRMTAGRVAGFDLFEAIHAVEDARSLPEVDGQMALGG